LLAMAFLGASPSMADTALCTADESPCTGSHIATHLHETSVGKTKLLTSPVNIECNVLFLGDTVEGTKAPLVIKGNFTYSSCGAFCTVVEENGPSELKASKVGHETASVTGEVLVHVKCGGFINCNYAFEGLEGTAKGPLLSAKETGDITFPEQEVTIEGGTLCPEEEAALDTATFTPLLATYIVGGAQPTEPTKKETLGLGNPGDPNICKVCAGDPIDTASGNLTEEQTDIPALGGRGPALGVTRSYNAQLAATAKEAGAFGYGWTGPYSASLSFDEKAKTATVLQDNGSTATFYEKAGKYVPPEWTLATLKESGKNWIFT